MRAGYATGIVASSMSAAEILEELPKLSPDELTLVHEKILELEEACITEPSPEFSNAIEEGLLSMREEPCADLDEVRAKISAMDWKIGLTRRAQTPRIEPASSSKNLRRICVNLRLKNIPSKLHSTLIEWTDLTKAAREKIVGAPWCADLSTACFCAGSPVCRFVPRPSSLLRRLRFPRLSPPRRRFSTPAISA